MDTSAFPTKSTDTDVLVVGAGPTGLMLANQLSRRSVRTLIIDRHPGPALQTRAMAVHARTLEIYSKLGIADRALELGRRGYGANVWANGQRKARIPLRDIGSGLSPFPFVLMLGQDDNEKIMGERLRHWGNDVQWNTELIALQQEADHVRATLKQPDGTLRTVTAAYVAGCDGGRSTVRELSGFGFPGAPYEHVFFVADTEAVGDMVPDELNVYLWRDGFHLLFPMSGTDHWRVIGIFPADLRGQDNLAFDAVGPRVRDEVGTHLEFKACSWFSTYRISHRCTERFRDRRCFLLGDAAHVHSPMGGQGMNTGLQDAYNLAWKLALVVAGRADAALLDSYEKERMKVAHDLLGSTDRMFRLLVSKSWLSSLFRTGILAKLAGFAMGRERVKKLAFRTISQIGISYPDSPLSQNVSSFPKDVPRAGMRFPWVMLQFEAGGPIEDLFQKLDDTRFNLIVIGQPIPPKWHPHLDSWLSIWALPDGSHNAAEMARAKLPSPAYFLLRPDGHVGLAGSRFELQDLLGYLQSAHLHLEEVNSAVPESLAATVP